MWDFLIFKKNIYTYECNILTKFFYIDDEKYKKEGFRSLKAVFWRVIKQARKLELKC